MAIMRINFQMKQMIQAAPNSLLHNMSQEDLIHYMNLSKQKTDLEEEFHQLMINDHDL